MKILYLTFIDSLAKYPQCLYFLSHPRTFHYFILSLFLSPASFLTLSFSLSTSLPPFIVPFISSFPVSFPLFLSHYLSLLIITCTLIQLKIIHRTLQPICICFCLYLPLITTLLLMFIHSNLTNKIKNLAAVEFEPTTFQTGYLKPES